MEREASEANERARVAEKDKIAQSGLAESLEQAKRGLEEELRCKRDAFETRPALEKEKEELAMRVRELERDLERLKIERKGTEQIMRAKENRRKKAEKEREVRALQDLI